MKNRTLLLSLSALLICSLLGSNVAFAEDRVNYECRSGGCIQSVARMFSDRGECTATLIEKNVMITAGHCVPHEYESGTACDSISVQFLNGERRQCKKIQYKSDASLEASVLMNAPDVAFFELNTDVDVAPSLMNFDFTKQHQQHYLIDVAITDRFRGIDASKYGYFQEIKQCRLHAPLTMTWMKSQLDTKKYSYFSGVDCAFRPGNSGSPIFDHGKIVGILSAVKFDVHVLNKQIDYFNFDLIKNSLRFVSPPVVATEWTSFGLYCLEFDSKQGEVQKSVACDWTKYLMDAEANANASTAMDKFLEQYKLYENAVSAKATQLLNLFNNQLKDLFEEIEINTVVNKSSADLEKGSLVKYFQFKQGMVTLRGAFSMGQRRLSKLFYVNTMLPVCLNEEPPRPSSSSTHNLPHYSLHYLIPAVVLEGMVNRYGLFDYTSQLFSKIKLDIEVLWDPIHEMWSMQLSKDVSGVSFISQPIKLQMCK